MEYTIYEVTVGVRAAGQVNLSVSSRVQAMQVCYDRLRLVVQ